MAQLIDSNATLWHNVEALMLRKYGKVNLKGFSTFTGVGLATVQRIQAQKTSVGLAILDKIAEKFDLAAWQLLVPGLDPEHPPVLQPVNAADLEWRRRVMSIAKEIIASEPDSGKYL